MAFAELAKGLKLPEGASDRYRLLEALGRMLDGTIYDDLRHSWETEKANGTHVSTRDRRPSLSFCLPWEITQDTLTELFGDEQFPSIRVVRPHNEDADTDAATKEIATLIEVVDLQSTMVEAYEEGVIGGVGVILHATPEGTPYYEIIPAKWCDPIYRDQYSNVLTGLIVTYPISAEEAERRFPGILEEDGNEHETDFWYRFSVTPMEFIDYYPLSDGKFSRLGEKDDNGEIIAFSVYDRKLHGFKGKVPAVYVKNLGGKQRALDGPALWWPIRDICIVIDYTLSQADRGLRYSADPMLFLNPGGSADSADFPGGYAPPGGGMATNIGEGGEMVKGVTQTLVGYGKDADAKLLEIGATGIKEEREMVKDLREYALEVLGGVKSRAEHASGPTSGRAIDKTMKPLRRLIRRQRTPYGKHLLVELLKLTIFGIQIGTLDIPEVDIEKIPQNSLYYPEWPKDDVLQGSEKFYDVQADQLAAGGSLQNPIELIKPEAIGAQLAGNLGIHEPYESIKGSLKPQEDPNADPKPTSSGASAAS